MADASNRRREHRPHRLSLPARATGPPIATSRPYPPYPYPPSTPTPTPSKHRLSSSLSSSLNKPPSKQPASLSFFFLFFSLRSLYSLLPFLRSSPPSFSLFPFSFLVSLLSFLLTLSFSLFPYSPSSRHSLHQKQNQPFLFLTSINRSQNRHILAKSVILSVVFLLRFQALRYCGTSAMILAEMSGNVAARFVAEGRNRNLDRMGRIGSSKVRGLFALFTGLLLLSISWDRIECFPFSFVNIHKPVFSIIPNGSCVRVWPMLLPFLSGFLGCFEGVYMDRTIGKELGRKRVRLISLLYTTVLLFVPAVISMFVFEAEGDSISIGNLGWPLANTVVFGVLLSENNTEEKAVRSKYFLREFLVTFVCTVILELFYYPELSLWGLLVCGLLCGIAVRELDPVHLNYLELGLELSDSIITSVLKPIRHVMSERRSRKIALFLLINTGYMVVEFVAGFVSNSLGLISDACHMLFDCAALAIGLYASYISRLPANNSYNYGRGRFEVLSGYVNAVFLVLVGALIVLESLERILEPQEISTGSLLTVSIGGLVVNVVGLVFFHDEHHHAHGGTGSCSHSHHDDHHHSHDHISHISSSSDLKNDHTHDHNGHEHQHRNCHLHHVDDHGDVHDHDHRHHNHHDHHHNHGFQHDHGHHANQQDRGPKHGHHHHEDLHDHHHHHSHLRHHPREDIDSHGDSNNLADHHDHGSNHHHHHADADSHGVILGAADDPSGFSLEEQAQGHKHHLHITSDPSNHHHHHHIDHNMQGIFLHVLADTLGSVGVVISTLLIRYKGWLVADPACSIFISVLIISSVIPLLRNSAEILLQRVPRAHEQDLKEAVSNIMKIKGVRGIQNLHVWSFTNTEVVGTLHLQVASDTDEGSVKSSVSEMFHDLGIKDFTLQVECLSKSQ